jgi:hypothetical protein
MSSCSWVRRTRTDSCSMTWWLSKGMSLKSGAIAATTAPASNGHTIVPNACVNARSTARTAVRKSRLSITSARGRSAPSAPLISTSGNATAHANGGQPPGSCRSGTSRR